MEKFRGSWLGGGGGCKFWETVFESGVRVVYPLAREREGKKKQI